MFASEVQAVTQLFVLLVLLGTAMRLSVRDL
jgi:hypothetical protein